MARLTVSLLAMLLILGGLWLFFPRTQPTHTVASMGPEVWFDFKAPKNHFQVKLPGLPHHATETIEDPTTHEKRLYDFFISSKNDGTIYAVNTIVFPSNSPGNPYDEVFLRDFIRQMLTSNPLNKIKTMDVKPFHASNAVDFKVENAEVTIDGKAFFDDNTLYILSTTARNDLQNSQEYQIFVNSFKLPQKEKSAE